MTPASALIALVRRVHMRVVARLGVVVRVDSWKLPVFASALGNVHAHEARPLRAAGA